MKPARSVHLIGPDTARDGYYRRTRAGSVGKTVKDGLARMFKLKSVFVESYDFTYFGLRSAAENN